MSIEEIAGVSREEFWKQCARKGTVGWWRSIVDPSGHLRSTGIDYSGQEAEPVGACFVFTGRRPDGSIGLQSLTSRWNCPDADHQRRAGEQDYQVLRDGQGPECAVLDLGLGDPDAEKVVQKALDMVVKKIMYPVSGLFGRFRLPVNTEKWRNLWNTPDGALLLSLCPGGVSCGRDRSCRGVATTHTSPEHLWQTKVLTSLCLKAGMNQRQIIRETVYEKRGDDEIDLVFEGGGAKGMVFVGAYEEFVQRGHAVDGYWAHLPALLPQY